VHMLDGINARDLRHERAVDAGGRVTVMLAGEHPIRLARVRSELEQHGFTVVAEAANADDAIRAAREHEPQLCLLDIDMPGGGILAADRISLELPDTRIAVMSGEPQPDQLRDAILAGADGYLPTSTSPERLPAALSGLVNGEAALTRAMTGQLVREYRQFAPRSSDRPALFTGVNFDNPALPPRSRLRYVPRLWRHYRHRRGGGMPMLTAWTSARARMADYL
jgi:DNA-binding NarL/FixJ family response regulator